MLDVVSVARLIRSAREARGFSRAKVSADTGIPFSTLTSWELGPTEKPSIKTLATLVRYLGIDGNDLVAAALGEELVTPRNGGGAVRDPALAADLAALEAEVQRVLRRARGEEA